MKEIWKDLDKTDGAYEISNMGRVRNVKTGRILKNEGNKTLGAIQFTVSINGKHKNINIGREVYNHFALPLNEENVIFHRDGDKRNAKLDNIIVFENVSKLKSYLLLTGFTSNAMSNPEVVKKQLKTRFGNEQK